MTLAAIIRRFLNLLQTLGFFSKHYKLSYSGDIVSFNQLYAGGHWSKRSAIKTRFHGIFKILLLEAKVKPLTQMSLFIFFKTRHDPDNIVLTGKFLLDTMKGTYIPDDSTKFYKSIHVIHDESLTKGELQFHIIGE
jgi:hypothetical protein